MINFPKPALIIAWNVQYDNYPERALMVFVIKKLKMPVLKIDAVRLELLNVMRAEGRIHKQILQKTTATWTGDKPTFETLISMKGGDLTVFTGPGGNEMGAKKWGWLDQGTRVRYATMSQDWISKTRVKWFGSRGGRGRMLFVRRDRPRPGIEARGWSEAGTLLRQKPFLQAVFAGIERGLTKMWAKQ